MRIPARVVFLVACGLTSTFAAGDSTQNSYRAEFRRATGAHYANYYGMSGGFTTGVGVTYRRWFGERYAAQLTVGPDCHEDDLETRAIVSTALTAFRSFVKGDYMRFLGYVSGHYLYRGSRWEGVPSSLDPDGVEAKHWIAVGAGAGIEVYVWRLAFSLMAGIVPSWLKDDDSAEWRSTVAVLPELGLYFRF